MFFYLLTCGKRKQGSEAGIALHTDLYINNLDTGLPSLNVAIGDPFKLTSPAQHASRWRMRGSQTCRLLCLCCQLAGCQDDAILRVTGVYARKFRNEITRAMHARQERWVWRARGLAVIAAHRSIYKYLDTGLPSLSVCDRRPLQTDLSCPACITLTHARQPNLSSDPQTSRARAHAPPWE